MGHDHRSCPNPAIILKPRDDVAFVTDDADYEGDAIGAFNFVSIEFKTTRETICDKVFSIFDTGSPVSFIKASLVPKELVGEQASGAVSKYKGIGGNNLVIIKQVKCRIQFLNKSNEVELNVIPNESMIIPVILGRDFLRTFNIELRNSVRRYTKRNLLEIRDNAKLNMPKMIQSVTGSDVHPAVMMPTQPDGEFNQIKTNSVNSQESNDSTAVNVPDIFAIDVSHDAEDIDIDPKLAKDQRDELRLIDDAYFNHDIKPEPFNYEMKIHLTTDVPFHCAPRRLSYSSRCLI